MKSVRTTLHTLLDVAASKTASYAPAAVDFNLDRYVELVVELTVTAADAAGTYDFYLITGAGDRQSIAPAEWDLAHFPQIAGAITTTPKTYIARIRADLLPQTVTTAAPGVPAIDSGTLAVGSGGANAPESLTAGSVRHGAFGNTLRYALVAAGTITTGVIYTIRVQARS